MKSRMDKLMLLLFYIVMLAVVGWCLRPFFMPDKPIVSATHADYTVLEGDTLWGISQKLFPGEDPRRVVDELMRINGLRNAVIYPYQQLKLPKEEK